MYGLVFGGGGAKGSYQIGVWKALDELNIEVGIVCGTSVGALNGALFAQKQYDVAKDMWENINMHRVFNADNEIFTEIENIAKNGIFSTSFHLLGKIFDHVTEHKGLDITPLRSMITELLDEDLLRNSGIEFGLVTVSINETKPLRIYASDIDYGQLKYYLLGSALVPGFTQDKDSDLKFIDGGVYDNLPVKMVADKGYKNIIAVRLQGKRDAKLKGVNIINISPSESLGNFLYFEKEKAIRNMEMGYLDAMKAFNVLRGNKYYFYNVPAESDIVHSLLNLSDIERKKICNFLRIKVDYSDRYLLEKVIPKLESKYGVKLNTYQEFVYTVTERLLDYNNEPRLTQYSLSELPSTLCRYDYRSNSLEEISCIILNKIR